MQALVDTIIALVDGTGEFTKTGDEIFEHQVDYPAFVITERKTRPEYTDTQGSGDFRIWEYTSHIFVKKADGYEELERLTKALKTAFIDKNILITSEHQYEAMISGRDVLVNDLKITAESYTRYE